MQLVIRTEGKHLSLLKSSKCVFLFYLMVKRKDLCVYILEPKDTFFHGIIAESKLAIQLIHLDTSSCS